MPVIPPLLEDWCIISMPQASDETPVMEISRRPLFCAVKYPPAGNLPGSARNQASVMSKGAASAPVIIIARKTRLSRFTFRFLLIQPHGHQHHNHRGKAGQSARQPDDQPAIMLVVQGRHVQHTAA